MGIASATVAFAERDRDVFGFTSVSVASSAAFFVFVVFGDLAAVVVVVRRFVVFLGASICSVSSVCSAVSLMAGWVGSAPGNVAFPDGIEKVELGMGLTGDPCKNGVRHLEVGVQGMHGIVVLNCFAKADNLRGGTCGPRGGRWGPAETSAFAQQAKFLPSLGFRLPCKAGRVPWC